MNSLQQIGNLNNWRESLRLDSWTEGSLPTLFAGVTANGHLVSSNNLENRPEVRQLFEFFRSAGHKTERSVKSSTPISKYFKKA